jgi:SynChlorMet cassette protein ScmC
MPSDLKLDLADGQRWFIHSVDDKASAIVAELGRAMRLDTFHRPAGPSEKGRDLYVAASCEYDPSDLSGSLISGPVVCCIPEPTEPDLRVIGMERIASTIARELLDRGGLLLHGALAEYRGSGFVMAGPGTIGKSTASSRLPRPWRSLCDDTTLVVRDRAGRWRAHPWPTWSRFFSGGPGGSWPVESAVPLRAVFFLAQSPSDRLETISATQATALTLESVIDLGREASCLVNASAARALCTAGVRAAQALVSAVPAFTLKLSLDGRFWDEIERVLPPGDLSEPERGDCDQCEASIDSFTVPDSLRLVYAGTSMNPTLVEPELLHVKPYVGRRTRPGDVVCFKPPGGDVTVVHRVIAVGRRANDIRTRGDNSRQADPWVLQAADIVGRVTVAQRGTQCRRVYGGWPGLAVLVGARLRRAIRGLAGHFPRKLYGLIVDFAPFDHLLPRSFRPRLVRFDARYRVFVKLLMGGRTVGQYDDLRGEWHMQRPFHLFVDGRALSKAAASACRRGGRD